MIYVHTLGTASIDVGSCTINPTSPRKFALLLYLAAERGRPIPRTTLQELVFPDQAERNARHSLRELVYQLRQLGAEVETGSEGLRIPKAQARFDYDLVVTGEPPGANHLVAASDGFLPGFVPSHSEAYADWYEAYRARTISALSRTMVKEIDRAKSSGEWEATERAARGCLGLDPLNELATMAMAEMLVLQGAKARAVKLIDDYMQAVGAISPDLRLPAKLLRRRLEKTTRSTSRYTARFVGRSDEMKRLDASLRQACSGEAQFAIVSGEPGIGKSRLLSEFRTIIELDGYRCASVAMQSHDATRPMGAFVDLVPHLFRMPGSLGCSPESMESLQRLVSNAPNATERRADADLELVASRTTAAICDLCEAIASEQPLILIIEDGHCLDQLSILTISSLLSSRREIRLLIVASTREPRNFLRSLGHAERVHHLPLRTLSPESTTALIADILDPLASTTCTVPPGLVDASRGNPLFAVSLATHFRETGDSFGAPATLVESIECRIDPLTQTAISVLATCVALGRHCSTDRLIRALELPPLTLFETLSELSDLGLLDARSEHVTPFHPLISEVLSRRLLPATQSVVNHRVAEVFEVDARLQGSPALWWEAGVRWRLSGNAERALEAIRECAVHAVEIGRASDAARMLSDALELPASRTATLAAARELVIAGDLSMEPELVLHGVEVLKRAGVPQTHDEIELAERRAVFRTTRCPDHLLESTRDCLRSQASAQHRLAAATIALKCADIAGNGLEMAEMIEKETSTAALDAAPLTELLEFALLVRSVKGEWSAAFEIATQLLAEVERQPVGSRAAHQLNAGLGFFLGGQVQPALAAWEKAFDSACACRSPSTQLRSGLLLATVNLDLHDEARTEFWLERCIAATAHAPELENHFNLFVVRIEAALARNDLVTAEEVLERGRAFDAFSTSTTRLRWGRALSLMIRARRGDIASADEELARALRSERVPSISGFRDIEIAAAAEVLSAKHPTEARDLITDYVAAERSSKRLVGHALARISRRLFSDHELDDAGLPRIS